MNESQRTHRPAGGTELSLWDVAKILLSKLHWVLLGASLRLRWFTWRSACLSRRPMSPA